jgi:hypothetical protein
MNVLLLLLLSQVFTTLQRGSTSTGKHCSIYRPSHCGEHQLVCRFLRANPAGMCAQTLSLRLDGLEAGAEC